MKPLRLTLKGFAGIRDGLGREELTLDIEALAGDAQLIALVGPNGGGKTTIIDNLHPYRMMPSRASGASVGSFSYYDHLCSAEASKDLEWMHEGRKYRSQLIFRMGGTRRTEAFVPEWYEGRWVPVKLADGTRSDGKTDSYDRCIEGLLGSPETFFTSAFHAQNRRQLSAYRPGEIKSLLVELLGLDQIRSTGQQAARVATDLQMTLERRRGELAQCRTDEQQICQMNREIVGLAEQITAAEARQAEAREALHSAERRLAEIDAASAAAASDETLRRSLLAQAADLAKRRTAAAEACKSAVSMLVARRDRACASLRAAEVSAGTAHARCERERAAALALVSRRQAICDAAQRLPAVIKLEQGACEALQKAEVAHEASRLLRQQLQDNATRQAALEREAGAAVLHADQLRQRFGLTAQVPCQRTPLQGTCKLLADARDAKALQPSADLQIAKLRRQGMLMKQQRRALQAKLDAAGDTAAQLCGAKKAHEATMAQRRALEADAALAEPLRLAEHRMAHVASDIAAVERELQAARAAVANELAQCDAAERQATDHLATEVAQLDAAADRLAEQLAALAPAPDSAAQKAAEGQCIAARNAVVNADAAFTAFIARHAEFKGRLASAMSKRSDPESVANVVSHLETEVALWTALAKALGNDGIIALCIDDAGPTLASLTNELLMNCYGPRFTVSITTQLETAKKDLKEGFDVIVFDADTNAQKSVSLMSGGERVWIDAALTRAIAIYLAQSAGRRYQTLFCDEADGPLDADHKRMFVAMKREVLRLGGYECEVFVSQTPQLWAMADCVIDVQQLALNPACQVA